MAINEAAYLKVGLGMIPEDVKREMLEKREDPTAEWRLPKPEERDNSLSLEEKSVVGVHLTAADVSPTRFTGLEERYGQNEVDLRSVANHPAFLRLAEIVGQMEWAVQNNAEEALEGSIRDLEALEAAIDEDDEFASVAEKKFIRMKVGGAKAQAHRAYVKDKRQNKVAWKKHALQTKKWKRTHQGQVKRMAHTAKAGYRRSDVEPPAAESLAERFTGRMQKVSDDHHDVAELRRLAGLTPSRPQAAYTTQVMDGRRPRAPLSESVEHDLAEFKKLAGL